MPPKAKSTTKQPASPSDLRVRSNATKGKTFGHAEASTLPLEDSLGLPTNMAPATSTASSWLSPKTPPLTQFAIVVVTTLVLDTLSNAAIATFFGRDAQLTAVSRSALSVWQILVVAAWKILELGVGWFGGLNGSEMYYFTLLTSYPHYYLLHTFYLIPILPTLISTWTLSALAVRISFSLFRSSSQKLAPPTPLHVTTDPTTFLTLVTMATALHASPLLLSLRTFLPLHFATYFDGIRDLGPAHDSSLSNLVLFAVPFAPMGWCSVSLLARCAAPTEGSSDSAGQLQIKEKEEEEEPFDPITATLPETIKYNFSSFLPSHWARPHGLAILRRTLLLSVWIVVNTAFLAGATVEGVGKLPSSIEGPRRTILGMELGEEKRSTSRMAGRLWEEAIRGSVNWGGVWGVGVGLVGAMFTWVMGGYA